MTYQPVPPIESGTRTRRTVVQSTLQNVPHTWTADEIREKIAESDAWVERALIALYQQQTLDEQESQSTHHLNGRGFNARDAQFGTSLAVRCLRNLPRIYGRSLTANQLAAARRMLPKYARQLAEIANARSH